MYADAGVLHAEDARAQLQSEEMQADQQHAFPVLTRQLHVFHAAHLKPTGDAPVRPEPGHADFEQAHADGLKIFDNQRLSFGGGHLRETEF